MHRGLLQSPSPALVTGLYQPSRGRTQSGLTPSTFAGEDQYSHADAKLKTELLNHLAPLQRLGLIDHWHDSEIQPGSAWEPAISKQLEASQLVLLLVSSDFIASDYCYENELASALRRHDDGTARVLPIILRPCLWQDLQFGKLQAAPREGRAVTSWTNADEALTDAAKSVREAAQNIRTASAGTSTQGAKK
ncbi:toll/interleukin-1 receptor domain-containing protein [Brevundimonas sp. DC300-4]|uniref:toll/interleukin-1 receptor domain-containing protein n=1 Tax=Brevundimonas sp. DC300-4 TaxID=2804594 RepID=UPI003CEBFC49